MATITRFEVGDPICGVVEYYRTLAEALRRCLPTGTATVNRGSGGNIAPLTPISPSDCLTLASVKALRIPRRGVMSSLMTERSRAHRANTTARRDNRRVDPTRRRQAGITRRTWRIARAFKEAQS